MPADTDVGGLLLNFRTVAAITTTIVVIGCAILGTVTAAQAAPPPAQVSAFDCFREWDANDNYVNEGWVGAKVLEFSGVFLGCGDERSGMIHIAHPDTTGTLHTVFEDTYQDFQFCFQNIIAFADRTDDSGFPDTRLRYRWNYAPTKNAQMIVDKGTPNFVWTMFAGDTAPGGVTNDWAGCAGSGARQAR